MGSMTIEDQVVLLMQGTEYGDEALQAAMAAELKQRLTEAARERRPLRVYCGFDPRTSDLHLGHTVPMRKLRQFQELGHEVTFLVGRFTSLIGDPSDKDKLRPQLTPEETAANAKTYAEQAFKILDPKSTIVKYNDAWLSKLDLAAMIKLASNFTLQQFLTRDQFRKRWDDGDAIYLHETFYALMQGYDAYSLRADVQVGGTDQLFNIITAARKLMEFLGERPNIGIIVGHPAGDGRRGQDEQVAGQPHPFAGHAGRHVRQGDEHPGYGHGLVLPAGHSHDPGRHRGHRARAGRWIAAPARHQDAPGARNRRHLPWRGACRSCRAGLPASVPGAGRAGGRWRASDCYGGQTVVDVLVAAGLASTRSEARRLVDQKAVRLEDQVLENGNEVLALTGEAVLRAGKRKFVRLIP